MPKPRLPVEKAKVAGAAIKNPQRFEDRKEPAKGKLGPAPAWFTKAQVEVWEGFLKELPWLTDADRALMEMVVPIRAEMKSRKPVGVSKLNLYRLCLAQLGATPADRSKITVPDGDEKDPDDEFYRTN